MTQRGCRRGAQITDMTGEEVAGPQYVGVCDLDAVPAAVNFTAVGFLMSA